jgi:hypothetical protein
MFWHLYKTFAAYALMIIILWAGAGIAVQALMKKPPTAGTEKRHRKLYVHSLTEDWREVK